MPTGMFPRRHRAGGAPALTRRCKVAAAKPMEPRPAATPALAAQAGGAAAWVEQEFRPAAAWAEQEFRPAAPELLEPELGP